MPFEPATVCNLPYHFQGPFWIAGFIAGTIFYLALIVLVLVLFRDLYNALNTYLPRWYVWVPVYLGLACIVIIGSPLTPITIFPQYTEQDISLKPVTITHNYVQFTDRLGHIYTVKNEKNPDNIDWADALRHGTPPNWRIYTIRVLKHYWLDTAAQHTAPLSIVVYDDESDSSIHRFIIDVVDIDSPADRYDGLSPVDPNQNDK